MANRDIMLSCLKQQTFPILYERGFTGKYPLFKHQQEDHVELIDFQANKWGGSFAIEVSAIFPNSKDTNYLRDQELHTDALRMDCTNRRYRLPGMFDGWFYYSDLYRKRTLFFGNVYHNISEKEALTFTPSKGYRLVQKFDEQTAAKICQEISKQLHEAFLWLEKFEQEHYRRKAK